MKAIVLSRVSTEKQSLESQTEQLVNEAKRRGYNDSDIIIIQKKESGIKLSEEEREGINELKQYIEAGGINCVFIWEISRLSRKANVLYSVRDYLQQKRVQLICMNPAFVTFTDDFQLDTTANMVFGLFSSLAENEMQVKKERFRRGKMAVAIDNRFSGGAYVKFGYKLDETKHYVIDEDEAETIQLIYHLCGDLKYSIKQIYKELHSRGINVSLGIIRNVLIEECYTGKKCVPVGSTCKYERQFPAIVTEEQFEKAKVTRKENIRATKVNEHIRFGKKILRCAECGSAMVPHGRSGHADYRCNVKSRQGYQERECTSTCTIEISIMDSLLWQVARTEWQNYMRQRSKDEQKELVEENKSIKQKIATAEKEMAKIETRLKRNRDAWILGDLDDPEYEANKLSINEKKNALAASISSLQLHLKNNEEQLERIESNKSLTVQQIKDIINATWKENDLKTMYEIVQKFIVKATVEYADEAQKDKLITLYLANGIEQHYIKKYYKREVHRVAYNKDTCRWIVIDDDVHFMYQYRTWE